MKARMKIHAFDARTFIFAKIDEFIKINCNKQLQEKDEINERRNRQ